MAALARLTSPSGAVSWICHAAPGHTPDRETATRFITDAVAWGAARAAIYGDPNAFWNSERRSAALTRERMHGWTPSIEEA